MLSEVIDVDLVAGRLIVRRAIARWIIGTPKSAKPGEIPLHEKVMRVLKAYPHLRGEVVFCDSDCKLLKKGVCRWPIWSACRRAGPPAHQLGRVEIPSLHTS